MGNLGNGLKREHGERGAALAEWAMLVMLVAIVAMVAVTMAGEGVSEQYSNIASGLDSL